jgi:hypothetical protein
LPRPGSPDQDDLTVPRFGTRPAAQQNIDFLIAPNQRAKHRAAQSLEPARYGALSQHLPNAQRLRAIGRVNRAEITAIKQVADQAPSGWLDCHNLRMRRQMEPPRQIRSIADNLPVLERAIAGEINR